MLVNTTMTGWSRIATSLDVEVQHGIPVRLANSDLTQQLNIEKITGMIRSLTGLKVSMHDWININADEQEWNICVDKKEFSEVLRRLALSSAALFVDRFHKPIDPTDVDWDEAEFNFDFNHAAEHCCIPYGTLNRKDYFDDYINTMHEETVRLIKEGISPLVDSE